MRQTLHLCMFLLHGPPYGCGLPVGVCLICLACAALWLRPPYGACALYVWHGQPYGFSLPMGLCFICLAWAALWLRPLYGACAQYVRHGPPKDCGRHLGRVLSMCGMGRTTAAATLWLRAPAGREYAKPGSLWHVASPKGHYLFLVLYLFDSI